MAGDNWREKLAKAALGKIFSTRNKAFQEASTVDLPLVQALTSAPSPVQKTLGLDEFLNYAKSGYNTAQPPEPVLTPEGTFMFVPKGGGTPDPESEYLKAFYSNPNAAKYQFVPVRKR